MDLKDDSHMKSMGNPLHDTSFASGLPHTPAPKKLRSRSKRRSTVSKVSDYTAGIQSRTEIEATRRINAFFQQQPIRSADGDIQYKLLRSLMIRGRKYKAREMISYSIVEEWAKDMTIVVDIPEDSPAGSQSSDVSVSSRTSTESIAYHKSASGDPDNPGSEYPSPMQGKDGKLNGYWCWSVRNESLVKTLLHNNDMLVPEVKVTGLNAAISDSANYHLTREKFEYSRSNPFKFESVSYKAFRAIQDAIVHQSQKGERAVQSFDVFDCFSTNFKRDLLDKLQNQFNSAQLVNNRHRLDGQYFRQEPSKDSLAVLHPLQMIPILLIATLPLVTTNVPKDSHQSFMHDVLQYEFKKFALFAKHSMPDELQLVINYSKIHNEFESHIKEIVRFGKISEWWLSSWFPMKSNGSSQVKPFVQLLLQVMSDSTLPNTIRIDDLYNVESMKDKKYKHFSHLLLGRSDLSNTMSSTLLPAIEVLRTLHGLAQKREKSLSNVTSSLLPNAEAVPTDSVGSAEGNTANDSSTMTHNDTQEHSVSTITDSSGKQHQGLVSGKRVCYLKCVNDICPDEGTCTRGSHDSRDIANARRALIETWSTGSTRSGMVHNVGLLDRYVGMLDDDDFHGVTNFVSEARHAADYIIETE